MNEAEARQEIVEYGRSIFERGLTGGSTGNISARIGANFLMTPTGSNLGNLKADRLSVIDADGNHISGDRPTKESVLHLAMYAERPDANAIVHLHSPYAVAISCLEGIDSANALPPITAYYVMRVGKLPVVPFFPPGAAALAEAVREQSASHHAVLLAHHGPVVAGPSLPAATDSIEELEQTARLFLLLHGQDYRTLDQAQVDKINGK